MTTTGAKGKPPRCKNCEEVIVFNSYDNRWRHLSRGDRYCMVDQPPPVAEPE